jgi:hypothetical protein
MHREVLVHLSTGRAVAKGPRLLTKRAAPQSPPPLQMREKCCRFVAFSKRLISTQVVSKFLAQDEVFSIQ